MLSIIIPSLNDPFLNQTVQGLLDNAEGEIEIIVNLDGKVPTDLVRDPRVKYLHSETVQGMRAGINACLAVATGKYIMKSDSHCLFGEGYDTILTRDMQDDWLVVPRRYTLLEKEWIRDLTRPIKDYHYLSYFGLPSSYGRSMFPIEWKARAAERSDPQYDIDETMTIQGSCYVANREYFMQRVGFLDHQAYTQFAGEPLEVSLKYWLCGGAVMVNKKTWYAHLFKNRGYYNTRPAKEREFKFKSKQRGGYEYAARHWLNNEEPGQVHDFNWLLEKFWPVPTWPEDRNLWIYQK